MVKTLNFKLKDDEGAEVNVQIRDFLSSDNYFKYMAFAPKVDNIKPNEVTDEYIFQNQKSQNHLILSMVINPKLTEEKVKNMDYNIHRQLFELISKEVFGGSEEEDPFLERGVLQGGMPTG